MTTENETYYGEEVAPKLKALAKDCLQRGLSFVAVVEWEPGEYGSTRYIHKGSSFDLRLVDVAAQAHGNVDSLMMALEKYATQHGHSSIYMQMRGIPETPA